MNLFFKNPSYIEVYDNSLTGEECSKLIQLFEISKKVPGRVGVYSSNVLAENIDIKKSIELPESNFNDGTEISKIILKPLTKAISKYHKKYFQSLHMIDSWVLENDYNFQKYETVEDGFKVWHTEHGSSVQSSKRILVWSIYLNNAKSGTEFVNYPTIKAKAGRCVIWPSSWTHIHKSEKNKGIKYILTGWISYSYSQN